MAEDKLSPDKAEERLWEALEDTRIGMLGVVGGPPRHLQPMTAFRDKDGGHIWFFTNRGTDLAQDAAAGAQAMFCLVSKDRELYACFGGRLSEQFDRERIDRYWNPMVAAWFPEGKDDPGLTLLRLEPADAQVWISSKGPIRFAYEIAKANLTDEMPDLGGRSNLNLQ